MRKLDTLALILTIVGGLNWGLVGLFRFDLVAFIFGGMEFGETNLASRIIYAAVGLSAAYQLGRLRAQVGDQERVPSTPRAKAVRGRDPAPVRSSRAAPAAERPGRRRGLPKPGAPGQGALRRTTHSSFVRTG